MKNVTCITWKLVKSMKLSINKEDILQKVSRRRQLCTCWTLFQTGLSRLGQALIELPSAGADSTLNFQEEFSPKNKGSLYSSGKQKNDSRHKNSSIQRINKRRSKSVRICHSVKQASMNQETPATEVLGKWNSEKLTSKSSTNVFVSIFPLSL